jgi:DNA-binding transcriptional LysR family regulator
MIVQLAKRGLGMAILPESAGHTQAGAIHALTITRPQLRGRLELAWRTDGPIRPAARALISHARRMFNAARRS